MIAVVNTGTVTVLALVTLGVVGFWLGLRAPARHERSIYKHDRARSRHWE